jgi:hypothetical protein
VSSERGIESNALLMSTVVRSVRCAGRLQFTLSMVCCVRLVSSVLVECSGLKPCCVGESGMCGLTSGSMRRSAILEGVQRSVIGL